VSVRATTAAATPTARQETPGVLYGETQTAQFVAAVRKLKDELRKVEQKARQARERVRKSIKKTHPRPD
jgi:hypothetical protein